MTHAIQIETHRSRAVRRVQIVPGTRVAVPAP